MVSKLYQLYYWELIRYMKKSGSSLAEAEDIVQETFLRALEHADFLETMGESQCRAWLYRTAKNVCIDRIRHEKAAPQPEEEEAWMEDFSKAEVKELCSMLPPLEQKLFLLRYFEGYNAAELGKYFHMPPATVRSRLMAARNRLRELYPELEKAREAQKAGMEVHNKEKKGGRENG